MRTMEGFDTLEEYIKHYTNEYWKDKDPTTSYVKDINGNILASSKKKEELDNPQIQNQLLFDILKTLIEIKDELKTKDEK